jgi:peptidylprolyl isomerase
MSVKERDWVMIEYTGTFDDGTVFDTSEGREPLKFLIGGGMVIPGFEKGVIGMNPGEEKNVKIEPKDGYGDKSKEIMHLPKTSFQDLSVLEVGKELNMMTNMGPMVIEVIKIEEDKISVILNHPMAGKNLNFKIKLVKVLDEEEVKVMEEEMKEMQAQLEEVYKSQAHSHHHCSDENCKDCDGDDSCDCEDEEDKASFDEDEEIKK